MTLSNYKGSLILDLDDLCILAIHMLFLAPVPRKITFQRTFFLKGELKKKSK